MRCSEDWEVGFLASSFFVGLVIGSTVLARFGDLVGRIQMLRIGLFFSVLLYAALVFYSRSLVMHYILIFGIGFFSCLRLNLGFIYGQEIVNSKHANVIGSLNNVIDGFTMIVASIYFKYISKEWMGL